MRPETIVRSGASANLVYAEETVQWKVAEVRPREESGEDGEHFRAEEVPVAGVHDAGEDVHVHRAGVAGRVAQVVRGFDGVSV